MAQSMGGMARWRSAQAKGAGANGKNDRVCRRLRLGAREGERTLSRKRQFRSAAALGVLFARLAGFGVATADGRVVDHPAAGAAGFVQAAYAIAAGLDHFGALAVAAGAGNSDPLVGRLVFALAHREVAGLDGHAVPGAV